jgi:hypothetical protein
MLRELPYSDIFTILFVLSLVLITYAKLAYEKQFWGVTTILTDFKYLNSYTKDYKLINGFEFLLFCNFIIEAAIYGTLFCNAFGKTSHFSYAIFLQILGVISFFVIAKFILEKVISYILDIQFIIGKYLFHKVSYLNFTGLVLIPINSLFIFNITSNATILGVIAIFLLFINSLVLLLFLKNNLNLIKENLFYFILYLCALEIAPYIVLCKLFTTT